MRKRRHPTRPYARTMRARSDRVRRRRATLTSLVIFVITCGVLLAVGPSASRVLGAVVADAGGGTAAGRVNTPSSSSSSGDRRIVEYPSRPNGDVVVYFHGASQDAGALVYDPEVNSVADALLTAGYVVASSDGGHDSWGDEAGVIEYIHLIDDLTGTGETARVYLMAESMGALTAAQVATRTDVAAWVAIYPVCDVSTISEPTLLASLSAAYPEGVPAELSPLTWPAAVPVKVWASPDDTLVSKAANADRCAARIGAQVVSTTGDHGDPSNFDGQAVVDFFRAGHGT